MARTFFTLLCVCCSPNQEKMLQMYHSLDSMHVKILIFFSALIDVPAVLVMWRQRHSHSYSVSPPSIS